jgi:MFS family permease
MSIRQDMGPQIGALIVATSGVQLAAGFFGTFMSLRVTEENFSAIASSLVLSSYFAGFTAGAFFCGRIIERVGHIRAYAAFGGLVVAATVAMPLLVKPLPWVVLRAAVGFGCAGLFVTTEGWLNAKSEPAQRGRVFSTYMVGTFIALGLGQLLVGHVDIKAPISFDIIVVFFAIALAIVSMAHAEPPQIIVAAALPYGQLARTAPVAVAGAALSGLISGAFYALVPVWMLGKGNDHTTIGLVMLSAVLGGLAFQVPIGRLSDRHDRCLVLAGLCVGLVGAAIALVYLPRTVAAILPTAALFGGFMATLYPVCVAHAYDLMPADRAVPVSSRLILLSGLGSVCGPIVGISLMGRFGIDGVLYLMGAAATLLALIAAGRSLTSATPRPVPRPLEILAPQAAINAQDALAAAPEL